MYAALELAPSAMVWFLMAAVAVSVSPPKDFCVRPASDTTELYSVVLVAASETSPLMVRMDSPFSFQISVSLAIALSKLSKDPKKSCAFSEFDLNASPIWLMISGIAISAKPTPVEARVSLNPFIAAVANRAPCPEPSSARCATYASVAVAARVVPVLRAAALVPAIA